MVENGMGRSCGLAALGAVVAMTLGLAPAAVARQVETEAALLATLNVGHISLAVPPGDDAPRLLLRGRILYPTQSIRQRGLLLDRGESADYWFLFRGDEPVTAHWSDESDPVTVTPAAVRERVAGRMLMAWWESFSENVEERLERGHQPPVADQYLLAMLSSRLRVPLEVERRQREEEDRPLATIELLAGAERLRAEILREAMRSDVPPLDIGRRVVPAAVLWKTLPDQPVVADVAIEPLARLAPPECFYVRFGKFSNFLWLTNLIREQGGDLGSMISARGFEQDMTSRFERQFSIRYSVLADYFGDQVVADLALIGADMYLADGSAMGVLLEAKNQLLLDTALGRERDATLKRERDSGVTQQTLRINGHETDLISTPDNRVRSFLASHDKFRLVTNSRHLVERFWAVVDGGASLGALNEFQHARSRMPADRGDTLFAYFSTHFFHNLVSPQYQIELRRRLRVVADFQLLELALIAARREGIAEDEVSLVRHGLLPQDWGKRADGSRLQRGKDGALVDSMRGARGALLPIPDVLIRDVSAAERVEFKKTAAYYEEKWRTMDPLMATVKRFSVEGKPNRERLVVDAQVSPFVERKYSRWLGLLGEPTVEQVAGPSDAIIQGQASLKGGLLRPSVQPHQLFVGIVDRPPAVDDLQLEGILDTLRTIQAIPGYLGAWPRPGFLDGFPLSPRYQEDEDGYSRLPLRLWRWRGGDYSVLSFDRKLLESVHPVLKVGEAEAPAQAWLRVVDLKEAKLAGWIRDLHFQQAVRVSRGNAEWLNTLTQTMGAAPEEALDVAGRLVDGQVRCPLGAAYERQDGVWKATCPSSPPEDFHSPLLRWFRGGAVMLNTGGERLIVHGEIDIQRTPSSLPNPTKFALPLLQGLPSLFGTTPETKPPGEAEQPSAPTPE